MEQKVYNVKEAYMILKNGLVLIDGNLVKKDIEI